MPTSKATTPKTPTLLPIDENRLINYTKE